MIHLPIDLNAFGFWVREKGKNGKRKKNRCGRDALYYVLHYYFPNQFNLTLFNPEQIENLRMFGFKMPDWSPAYSGTALNRVPQMLAMLGIKTYANEKLLITDFDFLKTSLLRGENKPFEKTLESIRLNLSEGKALVIDLSAHEVGPFMNHVIFIYGIDEEYLYCIDTFKLPCFEYEKVSSEDDGKFLMRYPLPALKNRWERGGVLWRFEKTK